MIEVKGYKAFNKNSTNGYGKPFIEGKTYRVEGNIKFGNNGNGYHMCKTLCDVFRYVNATEEDVLIAEVTGRGKYQHRDDEYYGYYDMYSFEEITINKFLSREEIIEKMLDSSPNEVRKFLATCRLSEEEKYKFAQKFRRNSEILKTLLYYHFGCKDVFNELSDNAKKQLKLVLKYGQDCNKGSEKE